MKPFTSWDPTPKGSPRQVYVVYYGPRYDRRRLFADTKAQAERIASKVIADGVHVTDHPTTWPNVVSFDRSKLRPWHSGLFYVANGPETIYPRP